MKPNKYFVELIIIRLTSYYILRDLSRKECQDIENILADLHLLQKGRTDATARAKIKGRIITGLRDKRLLFSDKLQQKTNE